MAIETERKFLVKGEFRDKAIRQIEITQAYLTSESGKAVRIRLSDNEAFLTIKSIRSQDNFAKNEWEFPIPYPDALELMKICLPGKIVKTRYIVPSGKHKVEVDVFHDKNEGLVIAEIELVSENEQFIKPEWLGEEVTGNPAYYNSNLRKQ
jgi:adenylate cyclase